jgi:hypothetical protein
MKLLLGGALLGLLLGLGAAPAAPAPLRARIAQTRLGGLSLTVRLDKQAFGPADEVALSFELKNESGKELFVGDGYLAPAYHEAGPGRHFEVLVTADGKAPLYFWSGTLTEGHTSGIRRPFRLAPGEAYRGVIVLRAGAAQAGKKAPRSGGSFENKLTRRQHVLGKDGRRYAVKLSYQVGPGGGVWQPPAGFKQELLWRGQMTAGPVELTAFDR